MLIERMKIVINQLSKRGTQHLLFLNYELTLLISNVSLSFLFFFLCDKIHAHTNIDHSVLRIPNMLHNLQNATLKIAAVDVTLSSFFSFDGKNNYEGVSFEILKVLALALNFTYDITIVRSGGRIVNGTWTEGVVKSVYEGGFDLGMDTVSMTYERYNAVDFSVPFMFDKCSIMSPSRIKTNRMFAIIQVFEPEVWVLLLVAVAIFGPIMKLVENIRKKLDSKLPSTEQSSIYNYVWISVCMALFKDSSIKPFKGSVPRLLVLFWTIMMMILVAMYSGVLLALMSEQTLSPPIDNFYDLVKSPGMSWGVFPSSATRAFIEYHIFLYHNRRLKIFQRNELSPYTEIRNKYQNKPDLMPGNISMAVKLLRKGKYALISDEMIFKNIRIQEVKVNGHCPYYISSEHLFIQWYSFITPQNCTYLTSINTILNHLIESGLIDYWTRETLGTSLDVCKPKPSLDCFNYTFYFIIHRCYQCLIRLHHFWHPFCSTVIIT
uniref:Ionotropic glutamate receptor C-terminal domain-containing protein n=1 Tax=Strigamia maritima TaxID=126957 RepID=T1JKR3_STRMM